MIQRINTFAKLRCLLGLIIHLSILAFFLCGKKATANYGEGFLDSSVIFRNDTVPDMSEKKVVDEYVRSMSIKQFALQGPGGASVIFINDSGKAGIFLLDQDDKSTPPDEAMVLVYGKRRYKRQHDYITPEMFGAKRDGITDDTRSIQQALDFASRAKGGKIVFSSGTYLVGATLKLKPFNGAPAFNYNLMLSGAGLGTTEIKGSNAITGNLLEMTHGQTNFQGKNSRVIIRDISFTAGNASRCFYADFVSQLRLEDCRFNGGEDVTAQIGSDDPTQNYSTYITRCYFGGWTTTGGLNKGTLVLKHSLFVAIEEMETDGGRIGIDLINSAACIVNNSKIEGCKYAGIRISGDRNGEHRITNNYIICYGGLDFNAQFDGKMHGILIQGNGAGSSATNTIANNIIRLEPPSGLNMVAKVSGSSKLKYNASDFIITGSKSGATAFIWGINKETGNLAFKPVKGKFIKGETISQTSTGGRAVIKEIPEIVTYGIKLESNNGANNISGNQLTTQSTYGIHISSDANVIIGNSINGATGVFVNASHVSLASNIFYCINSPAVAIQKVGGSNFTSLNNIFHSGSLLGMSTENVVDKSLQLGPVIIKDLPTSSAGLPSGSLWVDAAAGNVVRIVP